MLSEHNIEKSTDSSIKKDEVEIDLLEILHKIFTIRKILYKAAIIGLIIGLVVGFSLPKKYTVGVTLSPEMGNDKSNGALAGLAASFLGDGITGTNSVDALNISLSSDIVSSTPFLLELLEMQVLVENKESKTLSAYLGEALVPSRDSRARTRSPSPRAWRPDFLAPHERLPEILVVPREKTPTGAAARGNP